MRPQEFIGWGFKKADLWHFDVSNDSKLFFLSHSFDGRVLAIQGRRTRKFPTLLVHCTALFLPPVLVRIKKSPSEHMHMFFGVSTSIDAVFEELPALVKDQ